MIRLVGALFTIAVALCGYQAAIHWHDERHPLLIDASAPADDFCDFKPNSRPLLDVDPAPLYPGSVQPRRDKGLA